MLAFVLGFYLPDINLKSTARKMQNEARTELPAFIDLLSINVQAGMGLEQAMARVATFGNGTVCRAVRRAFAEARYRELLENSRSKRKSGLIALGADEINFNSGVTRSSSRNLTIQALADMANRFQVSELDDFVAALETADRQGVPITETLQGLAGVMREKKRARLVEAGSKSMVRMLFPVALFIMPAFLLLLLTPALIQFLALGR
jgi:tight adherence protein C